MGYTNFQKDLQRGKEIEKIVNNYYSDKFNKIETVSIAEEIESGIDRRFFHNDKMFTVEIKYDAKSAVTGNLFLESEVKSQHSSKKGWCYHTQADVIMVYAGSGQNEGLYLIKNESLKELMAFAKENRPLRKGITTRDGNIEWYAVGYIVALSDVAQFCFKFIPKAELEVAYYGL